ncbi:MAG: YIP1 family protein [Thermomicrobiales bacterium]
MNRIVDRSIGVAKLVQRTYREIAVDPGATREAAIVVVVVAVASGIGGAGHGFGGIFFGIIGAFISWLLFTVVAWFFGKHLFGVPTTNANRESLLRTIGYAQAPGILAIVGFIPILGGLIAFVGSIWVIVTSVFAIRQVFGMSTGRAIITAVIAGIATGIILPFIGLIFGIGFGITGVF